jgi:hypothetical protein
MILRNEPNFHCGFPAPQREGAECIARATVVWTQSKQGSMADKLSSKRRSEIARKAAAAQWGKAKQD